MSYPRFLFHKELAPEGKLIRSAEDEPSGEGWVDTPQKFDPAFVEPEKAVAPGTVPEDKPGFVPQPYPSYRYGRSGETKLVRNVEEDDALNPEDWKHSTADFDKKDDAPAPPPTPPIAKSDAQKAELYSAKVGDIAARVETLSDIVMLQTIQGFEEGNPKGARPGVMKAVEARLKALGVGVPA
jgi:hypothetical protein